MLVCRSSVYWFADGREMKLARLVHTQTHSIERVIMRQNINTVELPDELSTALAEFEMARERVDTTQNSLRAINAISPYRIGNFDVIDNLQDEVDAAQGYYGNCLLHLFYVAIKHQPTLEPSVLQWRTNTPTFI